MSRRKKNNIIIGALLGIVLLMAVGYAAFSSVLNIQGTGAITTSWNIQITNIETVLPSESGGSGIPDGYNISEPTHTPTSATFNAGFELPGSMIGYIVEVSNLGSLDVQVTIGNLSCGDNSAIICYASAMDENPLDGEPTNGFEFDYGNQDYSDIDFPLKVGKKHYIMITVGYDDVTEQPTNLDASIKLDLIYEQYKDPNIPIPSGETTIIGGKEVDIVSGGDGLYVDEYEEGKFTYKGATPDNYIIFNNEMWRIISFVTNDKIKIVKNESISNNLAWDESPDSYGGSNNWATPSSLNEYLNGIYLSTIVANSDKIVDGIYGIGSVTKGNNDLFTQLSDENKTLWQGKVGLMTVSEYLRANSNMEQCGTFTLNDTNSTTCKKTNWINGIVLQNYHLWSISPTNNGGNGVFVFGPTGIVGYAVYSSFGVVGVAPVLYLTSNIILTGSGTMQDPYVIE